MTLHWKKRYLQLAHHVSLWSKDPSTKVGAVAIFGDRGGRIVSQGFNGFPRNIMDSPLRLNDRPTKYKYVVHAEMNVIYNASLDGVSLQGSSLFVWGLPVCHECAKGIIQVGVKEVIMPKQDVPDHWKESWAFTKSMFDEANIKYEFIKV